MTLTDSTIASDVSDSTIASDVSDSTDDTDGAGYATLDADKPEYRPPVPEYTGAGADEGEQAPENDDAQAAADKINEELHARYTAAHQAIFGQDPEKKWDGTPSIGLSMFSGHRQDRQPSYTAKGYQRGFRTAPGAPMAHPPEGLIGGKALENASKGVSVSNPFNAGLTPESDWRGTFGPKPEGRVHLTGGYGSTPLTTTESGGLPGAEDWKKKVSSGYGTGSIRIASPGNSPAQSLISHATTPSSYAY